MPATAKVTKLAMTPREIAQQIADEVFERAGGTVDDVVSRLVKEFTGRRRTQLPALIEDWFATFDQPRHIAEPIKQTKKAVPTDLEKEAQRLERQAHRIRLAAQVNEAVERRVLMSYVMPNGKVLGKCTRDYVARVGGAFSKLGKLGDKKLIEQVYTERDLEKAKI
jgi:hypothetical protein